MSNLAPKKSDPNRDLQARQIAVGLLDKQIAALRDAVNREFELRNWLAEHNAPEVLLKRSNDILDGFAAGIARLKSTRSEIVKSYPDELDQFTETLLEDIENIPYPYDGQFPNEAPNPPKI